MSVDHIRGSVQEVIKFLTEHPERARSQDKPATATIEEGLRCRVEGPYGWAVITDMSKALGGGASAFSPGWLLRAAQASCVATMVAIRAAQEGIALEKLEVIVDSESDDRGLLGLDDSIPAGPLTSRTQVRISAKGVTKGQLQEIVKWAEAHSPVSDAVGRAVPRNIKIEIL